jgi:hypothetical protein
MTIGNSNPQETLSELPPGREQRRFRSRFRLPSRSLLIRGYPATELQAGIPLWPDFSRGFTDGGI